MGHESISSPVTADETGELLSDLVAIDTSNPPGKEKACAEFIRDTLTDWGIEAELVYEPFAERPQVLASVGKGAHSASTLVLNGHMDVVPAGDEDEWSVDPFGGKLQGNRVYGRGATDMKGGITAAMLAAREAANGEPFDGQLFLTFSVGEETGDPGTLKLIEDLDADFGVVLEPTELQVHTASKGTAWYTVTVKGQSSHASRPHLGENPLLAVLSMGKRIEEYRTEVAQATHPLLGNAMCTPTVCEAGSKENVIPSQAEIRFDRRFLPGTSVETIDAEMEDLFSPLIDEGFEVDVERTQTFEPAEISPDEPIAKTFLELAADVTDGDPGPEGKVGGTDQRFFINDAGIPAIVWGPGDAGRAHTVDEFAEIDPIVDAVGVLCESFPRLLETCDPSI